MRTPKLLLISLSVVSALMMSPSPLNAQPHIPAGGNAAAGEISCTGYQDYQFTATGLMPSTNYTATVVITSVCPGSPTPSNSSFAIPFSTPATMPNGDPFTPAKWVQVGNPNCNAGTNVNALCLNDPGQNYSSNFGINGSLSLNPSDSSTNNGCSASSTIQITAPPPAQLTPTPVIMESSTPGAPMGPLVCFAEPKCLLLPGDTALGGSGVSWNKFNAPSNSVVWVHAHIGTPSNLLTNQVTQIKFGGVTIAVNGTSYKLPDGFLYIDPSYTGANPTTVYNASFGNVDGIPGAWITTLNPNQLSNELFFSGGAIPVDSNLTKGGKATFSYTTLSNDPAVAFSWQWSAAVYTSWPTDWNQAKILPYHDSFHAGTPLNSVVQDSLIAGPRGGGGSNFTGSWSGTGNGVCK